jgi:gas vesicle structural protein
VADVSRGGYLARPAPSGLADVIDIILDKGLVVDAYVRVSLVGIELLTIDARIVLSSVDTYLRFAEATNRLDLEASGPPSLVEAAADAAGDVIEDVAEKVVEHKIEAVKDKVEDKVEAVKDKVEDTVHSVGEAVEDAAEDLVEHLTGDDRHE